MPPSEQIPHERYEHGARLKAYIVEVRKSARGPQIIVSRTHPGLIKRLFELEVPEIMDGVVEIKNVAREPGHRCEDRGGRQRQERRSRRCVRRLEGRTRPDGHERAPRREDRHHQMDRRARRSSWRTPCRRPRSKRSRSNDDGETALVIVPDHQLSLAIGKEGQNARLAARLTGLRVDIKSESQIA